MKCLVFSDSHGSPYTMMKALSLHRDAEVVFFLGDGLSDLDAVEYSESSFSPTPRMWLPVRGNCDFSGVFRGAPVKKIEEITLLGKKIVLTHGDLFGAKGGLGALSGLALERGADIVLFGPTHIPHEEYVGGEHPHYLFNPGSASSATRSFGILTLSEGSILFSSGRLF